MNAELISLIKWYIFDDGSIQNKLLNLQGEQLNKERLSFIFLDYLTKNNNLPDANVIEIYKNNWIMQGSWILSQSIPPGTSWILTTNSRILITNISCDSWIC